MFNTTENRVGAFAGLVALGLVLALTAMAFTALAPEQRAAPSVDWQVSAPEAPAPEAAPTFRS
ncbi:MAG: hypothetical protein R3C27_05500 [Hyphomonadaceae bacterium]